MSNNKNNNIDNLFKKTLQEQRCEPPEYIWNHIEQNLYARKQLYNAWWFKGLSAAAFIAIFIGLAQLVRLESGMDTMFNNIEIAEVNISDINVSDILERSNISDKLIEDQKQISRKQTSPKTSPIRKNLSATTIAKKQIVVGLSNRIPDINLKSSSVRTTFIPLTSKEALDNNKQYLSLLNTDTPKKKEREKIKMILSGHLSPTYSSGNYSSSVTNARDNNYSNEKINGLMNMGGGLKLAVHVNKRLSVQTGLSYSRMGQKNTESSVAPQATTFSAPRNNRVATFLGNIKSHRKADIYNSYTDIRTEAVLLNNTTANVDESIEQIFNTLSIPLHMRYSLNDNRILFSLLGGFSGDFIVGNKLYLQAGSERELIGSIENIRTFNISTDLGLGVTYPINSKIKVMIEPGFKYYLQSISRDERIDFKPYLFTFSTGVGFEF